MKLKLLSLLFSLLWGFCQAQEKQEHERLKQQLSVEKNDTNRVSMLNLITDTYRSSNQDSSFKYGEKALALARKINYTKGEVWALSVRGALYHDQGNLPKALETEFEALRIAEESNILANKKGPVIFLGRIYFTLGDYPKALHYARMEKTIVDKGAVIESRVFAHNNLASIFEKMDQLDSALYYVELALDSLEFIDEIYTPSTYHILGNIYVKKGNYELALINYHQGLQLALTRKDQRKVAETAIELARFYQRQNMPDSSVHYAKLGLEQAQLNNHKRSVLEASTLLSELYEPIDSRKALGYYKLASATKEGLFGAANLQAAKDLIAREEERQREIVAAKESYRNQLRQYALLGGLFVVLLVAFLLYRNNRQKQKANAQLQTQNRELEIEAALDKIRQRTLLMKDSQELHEVVGLLFQEFKSMGLLPSEARTYFCDINPEKKIAKAWMTNADGTVKSKNHEVPLDQSPSLIRYYEAWKNQEAILIREYKGKELTQYLAFVASLPHVKNDEGYQKIFRNPPPQLYMTDAPFRQGTVGIMSFEPLPEEALEIQQRFAKVFEFTYTRFLDLKKAEAQAQEAQIEVSLERVRSRSMAMHSSEELGEVAQCLFEQMRVLGMNPDRAMIPIVDTTNHTAESWMTTEDGLGIMHGIKVSWHGHPVLKEVYQAWLNKEAFIEQDLSGKRLEDFIQWIQANTRTPYHFVPNRRVYGYASFKHGMIAIIQSNSISEKERNILQRFAVVFEQSYTRFLDLQKAEAQTREAKIDAGLERVRAEIASMRSTEDLERITPLVWRELNTLEVPFFRCGVFIMDEANKLVHTYLSTPEGESLGVLHLPFDGAETTRKVIEHWRKNAVYRDFWDRQQFKEWVQSLMEQGHVSEGRRYQGGDQPPASLSLHFVPFTQGMLYVGSSGELTNDQIGLLQRLADTFAVAYARYEDFTKLEEAKRKVEITLTELKSTQAQLIQSEKMASLGELTAGIAHEIQNPLNFVNNFSEVSTELLSEAKEELDKGEIEETKGILNDLVQNLEKIHHHGERASGIVKGMLEHSRTNTGEKTPTNINSLCNEYLRLAYHAYRNGRQGMYAKDELFNIALKTNFDENIGKFNVIPQDIGKVLLNLFNNAFYACAERLALSQAEVYRSTTNEKSEKANNTYAPTVTVSTRRKGNTLEISVKDNGKGIPDSIKERIFQPFFTTKPTGQGTGLGLSLSYDIVKAHGGELLIESEVGEGATFRILLPITG